MLFLSHLWRLLGDTVAYAFSARRISLLFAIVIGLLLVAFAIAGKAAAPFVIYPFV